MAKRWWVLLFGLFLLIAATASIAKDKDTGRLLTGKVIDKAEEPLPDSVIYLTNTHTKAVKTYISGPDGMFRFPGLSMNVDYEIFAQYKGHKSDTKTVSQFDNRQQVNLNLRIDAK
jgi:hypothetical protein